MKTKVFMDTVPGKFAQNIFTNYKIWLAKLVARLLVKASSLGSYPDIQYRDISKGIANRL
jgi:hypothetical protein